jgi:apolipoprotein N-acyltransferase
MKFSIIKQKFFLFFRNKIFNKLNFTKFIIIFTVGFLSRFLVSSFYNINVYLDFLNMISVVYYTFFSGFIVTVHELVENYKISLVPNNFYINIKMSFSYIKSFINWNSISSLKLEDFKLSNLNKFVKHIFNNKEKITLGNEEEIFKNNNNNNNNKNNKPLITGMVAKNGEDYNSASASNSNNPNRSAYNKESTDRTNQEREREYE